MFRKPLIVVAPGRTETQYVTREVHEHRAPTDESVALLKEFEEAADKRRIATLNLESNAFHGRVFVEALAHSGETRARCVFDLNGRRIEVDTSLFGWRVERNEQMQLLLDLRDKLALRIASEVLTELASGTLAEWRKPLAGSVRSTSGPTRKGDAQ